MKVRLGINTCFAVKRWPRPDDWARIVRDELGRIDPGRVLDALAEAGAQDVLLVLEVIPAFEQDDAEALADLRASAELWQAARTERGAR